MTDVNSTDLQPVLKMGAVELPFPDGMTDPEAVKELYANSYPHLRQARLREPYVEGDKLVYEVEKPPAKTKG